MSTPPQSKRYRAAAEKVSPKTRYELTDAVRVLKELPAAKFNETVAISVSLTVDPKKTDQVVRGTVSLPHGTGQTRRVLAFCKGEKELQAKEAGADYVGNADLIGRIEKGWLDFDVVVATPDMMRDVSKLGRILGPRGLMPNPKAGTVAEDVGKAIREVKQGRVEFKMDKLGNVHVVIGKRGFEGPQLVENGRAALEAIVRARPATTKGRLLRRATLASTMGPGITLKTDTFDTTAAAE